PQPSPQPITQPTHWLLGGAGSEAALVEGDRVVSYAELLTLVDTERERLGARHLVALEASATVDFVVSYLAALADGHPVLLLAEGDVDRHAHLLKTYRPGIRTGLHPDLALLLSTSGSTGSPKLVRLSRDNVLANARSIADYLDLRDTDVAITSLPLHYCYGLSVLHSHLLVGATVVLTDLSVADACFWDLAEGAGVTGLAGVPHTFALLDAISFGRCVLPRLPSLRYLTQAGGRMAPERVRHYAGLLHERGVDLVVMYGQTEATARMAYLPPELALDHPEAIGVPIPGGTLRIEPLPDTPPGTGELVYAGPNVMMGYADSAADLARGPELIELHTGDLARELDGGFFQVVGRLDRQAKVLGHRVDVDRVEGGLADAGLDVRLLAPPDCLWAFVVGARLRGRVRDLVIGATGLRGAAVRVVVLDRLPKTAAGKPDDSLLCEHVRREELLAGPTTTGPVTAAEIRDLYAVVLGRPEAQVGDSFVALGGDSLSYVEVSTRLGARLGDLPRDWPTRSATELAGLRAASDPAPRRRGVPVDTSVALRAVAITLVVVTHADLFQLQGGAHVLLAIAGYNLARFQLALPGRRARVGALLRSARSVAIPAMLFIGAVGKSAQLPLYFWLPDAMEGPTPVSALIHAATMVTAGVFLMTRMNPVLAAGADWVPTLIAWIGAITALFAATVAVAQSDIKKVLAYSTVSQLGFMFLAVGSGAYVAAIFHMVTHAFFKALLFMGAGSVIHGMHHEQDMRRMGRLRKWMPVTAFTFIIGWLAIAGVPPFAGFWSKDEILLFTFAKSPVLYVIGLVTALLTAYYMTRQVIMVFFGEAKWQDKAGEHGAHGDVGAHDDHGHAHTPHESPGIMLFPLVVLAGLSIVGGFMQLPFS
ncbi:MAG TPA: proton-conducting transporter membrane subunit, partial [Nocardioides sp.]|nr:proton-conducting transporter membrane subunit [Nocardioides sp.]